MTDLGNVNYNSKITTPAKKKKRHGIHRNFTVKPETCAVRLRGMPANTFK